MDGTDDQALERLIAHQAAVGDILQTLGRAPFDLDASPGHDPHARRSSCATPSAASPTSAARTGRYSACRPPSAHVTRSSSLQPGPPDRAGARDAVVGRTAIDRRVSSTSPIGEHDRRVRLPGGRSGSADSAPCSASRCCARATSSAWSALWRDEPVRLAPNGEIEVARRFADEAAIVADHHTARRAPSSGSAPSWPGSSRPRSRPSSPARRASGCWPGHRREITVVFCGSARLHALQRVGGAGGRACTSSASNHAAAGPAHHRGRRHARALHRRRRDGLLQRPGGAARPRRARRARMALELRTDVTGPGRWVGGRLGHRLGLQASGIATGYATMGRIGFEGRADYAAIGSVVNLSARLCAQAEDSRSCSRRGRERASRGRSMCEMAARSS